MRGTPLLLLLTSCAFLDQGDLTLRRSLSAQADTSSDADTDTDTDTDTGVVEMGVADVDITACQNGASSLSLRDGGGGTVVVDHKGFTTRSCAELEVSVAWLDDTIELIYTDVGADTCKDECGFRLRYSVTGVPAGEWVVDVMGTKEKLTVD